eukprot:3150834-Pyramimonas_sp.AAC.1
MAALARAFQGGQKFHCVQSSMGENGTDGVASQENGEGPREGNGGGSSPPLAHHRPSPPL